MSAPTRDDTLAAIGGQLDAYVAGVQQKVSDAAAATIAALQAQLAAVPPVRPVCLYGATPEGPQSTAGFATMAAKWRALPIYRAFWPALPGTPWGVGPKIVGSCKTLAADPQQAGWQAAMWRWTYMHEPDVKTRKGTLGMTLDQWRATLTHAATLVNPAGQTIILSSWTFDPASGDNPANYWLDGCPNLAVDFDGMTAKAGVFPDLTVQLANVVAFVKAHGCRWGVAEFGCDVARADDLDGIKRAAWMAHWARQFADAGAEYVCLWEWDTDPLSLLTTPAERAVWASLIAA